MPLSQGDAVLVQYVASKEWHARYLLAHIFEDEWLIVTPDADRYVEDLGAKSAEIAHRRNRGADVVVPFGVDPRKVYDFNPQPSKAQIDALVAESAAEAEGERYTRGLPAVPVVAVVEHKAAAADGGSEASHITGRAAVVPPLVDHRQGEPVRGARALADALGRTAGGPLDDVGPTTPPADSPREDVRTLAIRYDRAGRRHREFREYVSIMSEDEWVDWPVRGPRTTRWVLEFMLEHGGTPCGWHRRWQSEMRLDAGAAGVSLHEASCMVLEALCCYDQINAPNSAAAEHASRQVQMVEEKWKDRCVGVADADNGFGEMHLFSGKQTRGNLCLCPALVGWISDQLKDEAAIGKERRKAREERALVKPKKEGGK